MMGYNTPHNEGYYNPLYILNNQGPFFHCSILSHFCRCVVGVHSGRFASFFFLECKKHEFTKTPGFMELKDLT